VDDEAANWEMTPEVRTLWARCSKIGYWILAFLVDVQFFRLVRTEVRHDIGIAGIHRVAINDTPSLCQHWHKNFLSLKLRVAIKYGCGVFFRRFLPFSVF